MSDSYFKKTIIYPFQGKKFSFDLGESLFSTFSVDHGTDILIRSIEPDNKPGTILDLGCGYGPIGITLAGRFKDAHITLVDRDLLAIRYCNINIHKNAITNAQAVGSVGMEAVSDKTFDLIVSNIPAKIGDKAITEEFILGPFSHLNPNGELWVVVINKLNRLIPKLDREHKLNLRYIRDRNGHTVYRMKKT